MKLARAVMLAIFLAAPAAAQPVLLDDLRPSSFEDHTFPDDVVAFGELALFTQTRATTGREPWRSDGTEEGTYPLADLCSGPCDSAMASLGSNHRLHLFFAEESLWRTDGTREGTRRLEALRQHEVRFVGRVDDDLLVVWSRDFSWWLARVGPDDERIENLLPVADIRFDNPWVSSTSPDGSVAYFSQLGSRTVWITDGTQVGTRPLPAFAGSVWQIHALGDGVLIWEGVRVWSSDGTSAGTRQLVSIDGFAPEFSSLDARVTVAEAGGRTFFLIADDFAVGGNRLWMTDGTANGSRELARGRFLGGLLASEDRIAYFLDDRLWTTDGTTGARPIDPPCAAPCAWSRHVLPFAGGFMTSVVRGERTELWWADGRPGGERRLAEMPHDPFEFGLDPPPTVLHGSDLFLILEDRLLRVRPGLQTADLGAAMGESGLAAAGPWVVFTKDLALWRTDGVGMEELIAAHRGAGRSGRPRGLQVIDGRLCAWVQDEVYSFPEIWCTSSEGHLAKVLTALNSLVGGTILELERGLVFVDGGDLWLAEGLAGFASRTILDVDAGPVQLGGRAVFLAARALWSSDGSVDGTRSFVGPVDVSSEMIRIGGRAFFLADGGGALWATDGTAEGTVEIALPRPTTPRSPSLVELGGLGWFLLTGGELWSSDGTVAGTRPRQTLPEGFWELLPESAAGRLFLVDLAENGLWATDGSASSERLRSLEGFEHDSQWEVLGGGDRLWIIADDGVHGRELWMSDGTAAGTKLAADIWPGMSPSSPQNLRLAAGRLYFAADDGTTGSELWIADPGGARRLTDLAPGGEPSFPAEMTAFEGRLYFVADDGIRGREPWSLPLGGPGSAACQPAATRLCLASGRFAVEVHWRDQYNGGEGSGQAVPLAASDRSGVFWFFDPGNVELIVKVLDGGPVNGHHWVFYGALTTVEYWLDVTDTVTGSTRRYYNPPGEQCGRGDTAAFPSASLASLVAAAPSAAAVAPRAFEGATACENGANHLCLLSGRFAVEVSWHDPRSGNHGEAAAIPAGDGTGYFWFFDPSNVELVVKMLDATIVNGHRWVFYGGLSDVEYEIRVADLQSGAERVYSNPFGQICGGADTAAFAESP